MKSYEFVIVLVIVLSIVALVAMALTKPESVASIFQSFAELIRSIIK